MRINKTLALTVLALAVALQAAADTEVIGQTDGGAHYKIVMPDNWNGGLVIWNHGFSLSPIGPVTDMGLLVDLQLSEGYAVAASSYRQIGWALFKSTADLRLLYQTFVENFEEPGRVIVTGGSLGGIVTAAAIEQGGIGNVVGAVAACGAVAGSRNWDGAFDFRLLMDQICANTPEAFIPGGAKGLPKNSDMTPAEVGAAFNACTGVDEKKKDRTRQQKKNLKAIKKRTGLPKEFLQIVAGYATFAMSDLIYDRAKLRGRLGMTNVGVDYGNKKTNDEIARVTGKKKAKKKLRKNFTPKGDVGDIKVVSIHTSKDGLVIVENQSEYQKVMPPENLTVAIVKESTPTHCEFTGAEGVAAWEAALDWFDTGLQPTVDAIQALCQQFEGLFGGPCRYDPEFVIPDMDKRIRPR